MMDVILSNFISAITMYQINKKRRHIRILLLAIGITLLFQPFSYAFDHEGQSPFYQLIEKLDNSLIETPIAIRSKHEIVKRFCDVALDQKIHRLFSGEGTHYDSKQSIFLNLICTNNFIDKSKEFHSKVQTGENTYLKETNFSHLRYDKECRKKYLELCNITELSEKIITDILADLFTIKHANIFGVSNNMFFIEEELEKSINLYANEKLLIPGGEEVKGICDSKKFNFPKTCNIMKKNIKAFERPLEKLKIIQAKTLFKGVVEKNNKDILLNCQNPWDNQNYDIILCGTLGLTNNGLNPFLNTVYNELTRYTLFTSYYEYMLKRRSEKEPDIRREINQNKTLQDKILSSSSLSIQDLVNIDISYPYHVGLLIYQEGLLRLRDKHLSKIVTPFYSIYHKLRNVQTEQ